MDSLTLPVNDDVLNINTKYEIDESIDSLQYFRYTPQTQDNNNGDGSSIPIDINVENIYTLPSKSYIRIKGQIRRADNNNVYDATDEITLINNAMMYLFSGIEYALNDTSIERISKNLGQISSMMLYLSQPDDFNTSEGLRYCCCKDTSTHASSIEFEESGNNAPAAHYRPTKNPQYNLGFDTRKSFLFSSDPRGKFSFSIPLSHIFGFAEYKRVIYGMKHTLTFTHCGDNDALYHAAGVTNGKVDITEISWLMPQLKIPPKYLIGLRSLIEHKEAIPLMFRARTSNSIPVTQTDEFNWRLSVKGGVEKPRWVIIAFQTDKSNNQTANPALFNHCNLKSAHITLNSATYPEIQLPNNFASNDYDMLYDMFVDFKNEYYGMDSLVGGTQVSFPTFKTLFPILVFDVRKQNEQLQTGVVDMQAQFYFNEVVPANTRAFALVISDRFFKLSSDGKNMSVISL